MAKTEFQIPFFMKWKRKQSFQTLKANKQIYKPNNFTGFIYSHCFLKSDKPLWERSFWVLKCHFKTNDILHPQGKIIHALLDITQEIKLPVTPRRAPCTLSSSPTAFWSSKHTQETGKRVWLCTHSYKVVREQTSPAVDLPLPPASILLPDVGDDLTHADRQLIIMLGLVIKLHYGLHCKEKKPKEQLRVSCHRSLSFSIPCKTNKVRLKGLPLRNS